MTADDGECRLELVWQKVDPRTDRRCERVRRALASERFSTSPSPPAELHDAHPRGAFDRFDRVEGFDERATAAGIEWTGAQQREHLAAFVSASIHDRPPLSPHSDHIADRNALQILHGLNVMALAETAASSALCPML
jgi:hypothetical protein